MTTDTLDRDRIATLANTHRGRVIRGAATATVAVSYGADLSRLVIAPGRAETDHVISPGEDVEDRRRCVAPDKSYVSSDRCVLEDFNVYVQNAWGTLRAPDLAPSSAFYVAYVDSPWLTAFMAYAQLWAYAKHVADAAGDLDIDAVLKALTEVDDLPTLLYSMRVAVAEVNPLTPDEWARECEAYWPAIQSVAALYMARGDISEPEIVDIVTKELSWRAK